MNEIFLDLVESVFEDWQLIPPHPHIPPPPGGIILSDSIKKENLKTLQKILTDFEKKKIEIEKDTNRLVIAIFDTIYFPTRTNHTTLSKHFKEVEHLDETLVDSIEYKIDLSPFNNTDKYLFKYWTEFPKGKELWSTNYPFHFGGVISFSRIYFDKNKKYGVLESGTTYEPLNGHGSRIFIKKESGKWVIDKIEGTWIS